MADASGVLKVDDAQRSPQLSDEVVLLVIEHGGAHKRHPFAAIDRDLLLLLDKGRIARLLDQSRDPIHHPVKRLLLQLVASWSPVERLCDPGLVNRKLKRRRTLWAEPP